MYPEFPTRKFLLGNFLLAPKVFKQWSVALSGAPATSGVLVNGFKLTRGEVRSLSFKRHSFVQYISSGCTWQQATRASHFPSAIRSSSFLRLCSSIACVSGVNRSTPPRTTRFFVRTKENERASTPQPQTQFSTGAPPGRLFFGFPVAVIVTHPCSPRRTRAPQSGGRYRPERPHACDNCFLQ